MSSIRLSNLLRTLAPGAALGAVALISPYPAQALGLDSLGFDANSLVSDDVVKSLTTFMAFGVQHRPYEPATPLGVSVGLDASIEVTLFKIPDSFFESLESVGLPFPGAQIPSLPIAKLHLHKGFGDTVDIGGSAFYFKDYKIFGGDIKFVIVQGEEGPTWALRFCYTYTDVKLDGGGVGDINVSTKTFSPQLLVSRSMEFADPYLGIGLDYGRGSVDATVTVPEDILASLPPGASIPTDSIAPQPLQKSAAAYAGYLFGGVSLRIPRSGLRFTIEGSYNTAGTSTLGLKTGFTF